MSHNDLERQLYENREKAIKDWNSLQGSMKRSVDEALSRGKAEALQNSIEKVLRKKFGPASSGSMTMIRQMTDPSKLDELFDKSQDASTFEEFQAELRTEK